MKQVNVKSTMVEWLLDHCAPHYCCSCGTIGDLLCESCKYDIICEQYSGCLLCGRPSLLESCSHCRSDIRRTWCGGVRSGGLEALVNRFKFEYAKAGYVPLGDIILAALPDLPSATTVVPIPTVRTHVRQRGYDHILLLARYVASRRGLPCAELVTRRTATVQRGVDRKMRIAQAKEAFEVQLTLQEGPYLLIDDVATTGSTLRYAAKAMKSAGATEIWAVAATRQALD